MHNQDSDGTKIISLALNKIVPGKANTTLPEKYIVEPFLKKFSPFVEAILVHALILKEYFFLFVITFTVPKDT